MPRELTKSTEYVFRVLMADDVGSDGIMKCV